LATLYCLKTISTIDKNTPSIDLTQIKKIQQDILQWDNQGLSTSLAKGLGIWHRSSINHYCRLFLCLCSGSVLLINHLQSNTLELDDKAQTLSYEHYHPYGGTAIIAGKDKTQVQQKRYRYQGGALLFFLVG
jgi:hypothetical protein